jgi:hypothetical protein
MSAQAIKGVALALKKRLEDELGKDSVFVGPLDDFDARSAKLILFLYRIVPNASLRNREHRVSPVDPKKPPAVFRNSLPLDLYFLVTVGTQLNAAGEDALLGTLGIAMQVIQANPELTGTAVGHETVRLSLEPLTTEETSRIWALFPTVNYRTSVAYLATPVWIDPAKPEFVGAPVVQDTLFAGSSAELPV